MNSKQRKQSMTRRHMQWPLGARVLVKGTKFGDLEGTILKHWREHPHRCSVEFPEVTAGTFAHFVPFSRLVLLDTHRRGERPWFKKFNDRLRGARIP